MPRKQEPTVIAVLDYFETAPLEAAKLALQLAGRAIRKREDPPKKKERTPATPAAAAGSTEKSTRAARPATTAQAPPVGQPAAGAVPAV